MQQVINCFTAVEIAEYTTQIEISDIINILSYRLIKIKSDGYGYPTNLPQMYLH